MSLKLDILAFAAHPDDAELGCAGTLIKHARKGYKTGIIDLTRGELGTRGTAAIRAAEAAAAANIMSLSVRENMAFRDGFFENDQAHKLALISKIRQYQPEIVIANALYDRHTDHGRASTLVSEACFLSGLAKIETWETGNDSFSQAPWRPKQVFHYIQDRFINPDFVVDISEVWDEKLKAILAFKSQFYNPDSTEPETHISTKAFIRFVEARYLEMGHSIGTVYGEGFTAERKLGIGNLFNLL